MFDLEREQALEIERRTGVPVETILYPSSPREQAARYGVMASVDTNPEEYARAVQLAKRTGLPVETVLNAPDEAKRKDTLGIIDFGALENETPEVLNLLSSIDKAKLASDDIHALSAVGKSVKNLAGSFGGGVAESFGMVASGTSELMSIANRAIDKPVRKYLGDDVAAKFQNVPAFLSPKRSLGSAGSDLKGLADTLEPAEEDRTFATDVMGGLGQLVGQASMFLVPGLGAAGAAGRGAALTAGVAGRGTAVATGALFAQGVDQAAELVHDDNASQEMKDLAALGGGAVTAVTERFAIDKVLGPLAVPVKNKLAASIARIGIAAASEGVSEATESVAHDTLRQVLTNPDAPIKFEDALYEGEVGGAVGGIARGLVEAALHVRARGNVRERKAQQAETSAQTISDLNQAVSASKLLARSPETFEQFIADAVEDGPVDTVYIDGNALMQSGVAEQLVEVSPAVAKQLEEAAQTGGHVAIPLEEYATHIAPTEHASKILNHLKTDPDGFSRNEAQEYMQTQSAALEAEMDVVLQEKEKDATFKASRDQVSLNVKEQLDTAARFTPKVNEAYSSLIGNYYAVTAAKIGLSPEELFQQYPLRVQAESILGTEVFSQKQIDTAKLDIQNVVEQSKLPGNKSFKATIAPVQNWLAKITEANTGLDITGFTHAIDTSAIKHVVKSHGNEKVEMARGQLPVTEADFGLIPEILSEPDKVVFGTANRLGREQIVYLKTLPDGSTLYLEEVRKGKRELAAQSMRKYPATMSAESIVSTLDPNAQGDSRNKLIIVDSPVVSNSETLKQDVLTSTETIKQRIKNWIGSLQTSKQDTPVLGAGGGTFFPSGQSVRTKPLFEFFQDYWMDHRPSKTGATGDDISKNGEVMPDDIYTHPNYYFNPADKDYAESYRAIKKMQGKPDAKVKVYRATVGNDIAEGDWVTLSPTYAKEHLLSLDDSSAKVVSKTVLAKEIQFAGDDINEFGYYPNGGDDFYQIERGMSRGAFNPENLSITLLKNADLSTFLHETGHLFLEMQERLVDQVMQKGERTEGEQSVVDDMQLLVKWFGLESIEQWGNLSLEEKRPHHERFARGFESYLFEGKAPNHELQGLFQRFRAWLLNVYKSLKVLNVELSDEVRGVFDRMLATNSQIEFTEQSRGMLPLFESAEQAGMTVDEFKEYQALGVEATAEAMQDFQARGLRDMQWVHNTRGRVIDKLKQAEKAIRAEVQASVTEAVMDQPVYQAWQFLKSKEGVKLSHEAVSVMYSGENGQYDKFDWKRLNDHRMVVKEGGLHPDVVAEMHGYSSGDEMIRRLVEAPLPKEEIEAITDMRMLEEHGEISTPEALERAADEAVHNEVRARMVTSEHNTLAKATGSRKILLSAARDYARTTVSRLRVRDIKPIQYSNAEARAATSAKTAMKRGDLENAALHKRHQILQNQAARAAYNALEEVESTLRYLKRFDKDTKAIHADYRDQIDDLLARFDLRKGQSLKAIDKRQTLVQWMEAQRELGREPAIPEKLEDEAYRTSYKNMTLEEFRGLADTIRQIEHLGRTKNTLLTAKKQRDYETARDELVASLEENSRGRTADARTPITNWGRAKAGMKGFWAAHLKVGSLVRIFDGGKDGGVWWEYLMRTANEAADRETVMRAKATLELSLIMSPVIKMGKLGGKGVFFPAINRSLNREAVLAIALNTGNDGNKQRLMDGEGWGQSQLASVLQSMTKQEWQAVQQVWDHFESYRPEIAAKERRVYGKEPEWVDPKAFDIQFSTGETLQLKGGYYPVKYDPNASERAESHADAEEAKRQMRGAYTTATTRRSFTKTRAEAVKGRPLMYSLDGLYSGVNEVIHDLTWHEYLIDANRLMRSSTIDRAIRTTYGPEIKQQIKKWLQDIAEGDQGATNLNDKWIGKVRQNVSAAGLGFNFVSALIQPIGITQSIPRIGAQWVGRGLKIFLSNPIDATKETNEKSDFMKMRAQTRFRELNELKNRVRGANKPLSFIQENAYVLMLRCQQLVDVPTWHGAYEKAIVEGNDEARAIALADQAVIDSQGSGMIKDLSAIEKGGGNWGKLFTVFYSFFNTAFNMSVTQTMTNTSKAKMAADLLMLLTVPAVVDTLLREALSFDDDDQDRDLEFWSKQLVGSQIDYLMGTMVLVREVAGAAKIATGTSEFQMSYSGPTGVRLFSDLSKLATQVNQGELDEPFRKALINVAGDTLGIPSAQTNRVISGTKAIIQGKTKNPMVLGFGFRETK